MSFFTLSTGEQAKSTTSFEIQGGESKPIPAGSVLIAVVTEAKWEEYENEWHIKLRWDVVGKDHNKRVVFQKLHVEHTDTKKRDKALMMLMAIDANSGGHLVKVKGKPSDQDLQKICNRKMCIQVDVWKIKDSETGEEKSGNWIKMVASINEGKERLDRMGGNPKDEAPLPTNQPVKQKAKVVIDEEEDDLEDLPF